MRCLVITFPFFEHAKCKNAIKEDGVISTLRSHKELNRYRLNRIYITEWGVKLKVINVETFGGIDNVIKKYPFYNSWLTRDQKLELIIGCKGIQRITLSSELT